MKNKTYRVEDVAAMDWESLTEKQLLQIVPFAFNDKAKDQDILKVLFYDRKIYNILAPIQKLELFPITRFIYTERFSKDLLRKFEHRGTVYHSPESELENCTIYEFAKADSYFLRYLSTKDIQFLNKMIAVLFRQSDDNYKPKAGRDPRKDFDFREVDETADFFQDLDLSIKQYAFLFFLGCKEALPSRYPNFFDPDQNQGEKFDFERDFGWTGLIMDVSETQTFAGLENTKKSNMHTVLLFLERKTIENKKALLKNKSNGSTENQKY